MGRFKVIGGIVVLGFTFVLSGCSSTASALDSTECVSGISQTDLQSSTELPLPEREGPRIKTSGRVPHVQVGVNTVAAINAALFQHAFALPGLENRPTVVSLGGARGMWLRDNVPVKQPKAIVRGREFAHIHTDGSLHAPLPLERAREVEEKGWGERHPWADSRDGWEGLVMLYSVSTEEELETLVQLVTESYNYVTGRNAPPPTC